MSNPDLEDAAVGDRHDQPFLLRLEIPTDLLGPPPQVMQVLLIRVVVAGQVRPRRTLPDGDHVRGPGCLYDPGCGAARPQVAATDDEVDGQEREALGEAVGVLGAE